MVVLAHWVVGVTMLLLSQLPKFHQLKNVQPLNQCKPNLVANLTPHSVGILDFGHFSIVVQLIRKPTRTQHPNKQFVNQGFLLL